MKVEMTDEGLYIDGIRHTQEEFEARLVACGFTVTNDGDVVDSKVDQSNFIKRSVTPDAPVITNEQGGSQSDVPVRFDLIDARALFEMAKVLDHGAKKYGANNWRRIPVEDHLNHLLMHTYAFLAGDSTDDHLSHILCRATFALGVTLQPRCGHSVGNPIVTCLLPEHHDGDHIFPEITGDY